MEVSLRAFGALETMASWPSLTESLWWSASEESGPDCNMLAKSMYSPLSIFCLIDCDT